MIWINARINGEEIRIPCGLHAYTDNKELPYKLSLEAQNLGTPVDDEVIQAIEYSINHLLIDKDQRTISYDDTASYFLKWEMQSNLDKKSETESIFLRHWNQLESELIDSVQ